MLTLKQARLRKELTQLEVAAAAGLTQTTLSQIERGRVFPRQSTVKRLEAVLGTNVDFGRTWCEYVTKLKRKQSPPSPRGKPKLRRRLKMLMHESETYHDKTVKAR